MGIRIKQQQIFDPKTETTGIAFLPGLIHSYSVTVNNGNDVITVNADYNIFNVRGTIIVSMCIFCIMHMKFMPTSQNHVSECQITLMCLLRSIRMISSKILLSLFKINVHFPVRVHGVFALYFQFACTNGTIKIEIFTYAQWFKHCASLTTHRYTQIFFLKKIRGWKPCPSPLFPTPPSPRHYKNDWEDESKSYYTRFTAL